MIEKAKINLESYDGVESLLNFSETKELENYKIEKLDETIPIQKCIRKIFPKKLLQKKLNVLEAGSGNSKLLYALQLNGLLNLGYGIEVSKSRYEFAEFWRKELKINNVKNINANILDLDFNQFDGIDLFVCVDIALQFFESIKKNSVPDLFKELSKVIRKNGIIILELWSMFTVLKNISLNGGIYKTWQKFKETDPFSAVLETLTIDDENYVVWEKEFIPRNNSIKPIRSKIKNILKPYAPQEIREILTSRNFKVDIYKNFEFEPYDYNNDEYVVLARK